MAHLGPPFFRIIIRGVPSHSKFLTPENPPEEKVYASPFFFLRSFPVNEAHQLLSGGPKLGVLGGGQKVYVEKNVFLCAFSVPYESDTPSDTPVFGDTLEDTWGLKGLRDSCSRSGLQSKVSKRGWREGVGDKQTLTKKAKKTLQKCLHREKRPESLAFQGFRRANPLCPPTPFRNF